MTKFQTITSYINSVLWIVLGILTIGSILLGSIGMLINILMGFVFILIGFYFFSKIKILNNVFNTIKILDNNEKKILVQNSIKKFISIEMVIVIASTIIVIVFLSAVISRIFGENLPIFG